MFQTTGSTVSMISTQPSPDSRQRRGVRQSHAAFRSLTIGAVLFAASLATPSALTAESNPIGLRCEYLVDPLGLDEPHPRLSWRVESSERGEKQTAYEILVASEAGKIDSPDLWDSEKVTNSQTVNIIYAGKPLTSRQRCFWKVKVWDKNSRESSWSEAAFWSMGMLRAEDWKAEWIGYDKHHQRPLVEPPFADASWIWHAADARDSVPKSKRLFL